MSRPRRIHFEGALFHVMVRGNRGDAIFRDQKDFQFFMNLLVEVKRKIPFKLYAYCLMPNHWHMLMRAMTTPISVVLHRLQSRYAAYFNRRHGTTGHLFQGRFKAIFCDTDSYLLGATRYIHLNPVEAGLAAGPADWPWSGQAEFEGRTGFRLLDLGLPLSILSEDAKRAERLYRNFLQECTRGRGRPRKKARQDYPRSAAVR